MVFDATSDRVRFHPRAGTTSRNGLPPTSTRAFGRGFGSIVCRRFPDALAAFGIALLAIGSGCATKAPPPPPPPKEVEREIKPPPPLSAARPLDEGVDVVALRRLVDRAELTRSSALVVLRNGKLIGSWSFDGSDVNVPLETANITPSLVALGIAALIDDDKLSYDDPIEKFFPKLKGTPKGTIRIRHIMAHTSGLDPLSLREIFAADDVAELALSSTLKAPPGHRFAYNNNALNLLPKIASIVWEKPFEHLMDRRIFLPMGIERGKWAHDKNGQVYAMSNLEISAVDLAKIGWMLAEGGRFQRRRILKTRTVKSLLRPNRSNPSFGRLWWMAYPNARREVTPEGVTALDDKGLDPDIVELLRDIQGEKIPLAEFSRFLETHLGNDIHEYRDFMRKKRVKAERTLRGRPEGFIAKGALGQSVVVLPNRRLVVVRQRKAPTGRRKKGIDTMGDIVTLSNRLIAD